MLSYKQQMDIQTLYHELSPFYILLYLHDVNDYAIADLLSLLNQLREMQPLGEREGIIHKALVEASCRNKETKLKNKKKAVSKAHARKRQSFVPILPPSVLGARSDLMNETNLEDMEFIDESCYMEDHKQQPQYEQVSKVVGKLFGGVQYIQLPVDYEVIPGHKQTTYIDFIIDQQTKYSKLNRNIVLRLLRVQKLINSTINLMVNNIKAQFEICQGQSVIGMDFLQNGKVIVATNYRPEVQRLHMIFTR